MIKESITIQEVVDFLNDLLKIDPVAIGSLFSTRTACNKKLADHDTVQVMSFSENYFIVGMIGILNGLFGKDCKGWGRIAADCDNGKITKFMLLTKE